MMQEIKTSMSHSGRKQYRKHWVSFRTFAKQLNVRSLPASAHTVGLYITHLRHMDHRPALKCSTIRTHLSAIASHHKLRGKKDPTKKFLINKLLTSFAKKDLPPNTRKGISRKLLRNLIITSKNVCARNDYITCRLAFSLLYHAALRSSEICYNDNNTHALQCTDIQTTTIKGKRGLKITLHSHKHSKEAPPPILLYQKKRHHMPRESFQIIPEIKDYHQWSTLQTRLWRNHIAKFSGKNPQTMSISIR